MRPGGTTSGCRGLDRMWSSMRTVRAWSAMARAVGLRSTLGISCCMGGGGSCQGGGPFDRLRANGREARLRCFGGVGGGPPSTGSGRTESRGATTVLWGCGWRAPFDRLRANGIARRDYGALGVWVAGPLRRAVGGGMALFDRLRANGIARRDYGALGVWVAGPLRQAQGERTRDGASRGLGWSESRIVLYGALGVRVAGPFDRLRANGRETALREAEERLPIHIGRIRCARPRVRRYIRVQGY